MIRRGVMLGATTFEWVQVFAASMGVIVAGLVAFMPYARRPKLRIREDRQRAELVVESSAMGTMPHVRLLVTNTRWRRAAQGTRVIVEGFRERRAPDTTFRTLGHPSLQWPSTDQVTAQTNALTVFAGGARPITLGYFIRAWPDGGDLRYPILATNPTVQFPESHWARTQDYAKGWTLRVAPQARYRPRHQREPRQTSGRRRGLHRSSSRRRRGWEGATVRGRYRLGRGSCTGGH